ERAAAATTEALAALELSGRELELDPRALEKVEERLFGLRALARKHQVQIADLPRLRERMAARLTEIAAGTDSVEHLAEAAAQARAGFVAPADAVSHSRAGAAARVAAVVSHTVAPQRVRTDRLFED